jgi:SAM-dependent methyltransferase
VWARQDAVRRNYVREMFGRVAPRYDLLNSILSLQLHHLWRRTVVRMLRLAPDSRVLDLCTGTGDLAIELARVLGPAGEVVALDFCEPMLQHGTREGASTRAEPHGVAAGGRAAIAASRPTSSTPRRWRSDCATSSTSPPRFGRSTAS